MKNKNKLSKLLGSKDSNNLVQADAFRTFNPPNGIEADNMSNTFNIWDRLNLFYRTTRQQNILHKKGFNEPIYDKKCIDGQYYETTVKPAQIKVKGEKSLQLYYLSENEEMVIKALTQIWLNQNNGFITSSKNPTMFVIFKMKNVLDELEKINKGRSFAKIYKSIEICHNTNVACKAINNKQTINSSTIFPTWDNANITGEKYHRISFCSGIMDALLNYKYRQYNYIEVYSHNCRLKRWILMRLITDFRGVTRGGEIPYKICYKEILEESNIFPNMDNWRNNMKYIRKTISAISDSGWIYSQDSLDNIYELKINASKNNEFDTSNIKKQYIENICYGLDGKTRIDCKFKLFPTKKLINEIISANSHAKELRKHIKNVIY